MKKRIVLVLITLFLSMELFALPESEFLNEYKSIATDNDPEKSLIRFKALLSKTDEYQTFVVLPAAAKMAFQNNDYSLAKSYANKVLVLSENYRDDWNYGNAIHDGNMILGRVAIKNGNTKLASEHLIKSGKTTGSPQLGSFGPNMSLANDFLDRGETEVVIKYFELCKNFWKMNDGRLDSWSASIRGGGRPYFGSNLRY